MSPPPRRHPHGQDRAAEIRRRQTERQSATAGRNLTASGGGRVETLKSLDVPRSTLGTLVKRGLVEISKSRQGSRFRAANRASRAIRFQLGAASRAHRLREAVDAQKFSGMLLHGVTGSGKTAVYLAGMRAVLEAGRSAILLVPEIGLTPAVAADLHQISVTKSPSCTPPYRQDAPSNGTASSEAMRGWSWARAPQCSLRSPTRLIIVDEEHDSSYKQEETPRYHARDVAIMRAKMANAVVVSRLGDPVPRIVFQRQEK